MTWNRSASIACLAEWMDNCVNSICAVFSYLFIRLIDASCINIRLFGCSQSLLATKLTFLIFVCFAFVFILVFFCDPTLLVYPKERQLSEKLHKSSHFEYSIAAGTTFNYLLAYAKWAPDRGFGQRLAKPQPKPKQKQMILPGREEFSSPVNLTPHVSNRPKSSCFREPHLIYTIPLIWPTLVNKWWVKYGSKVSQG